LENVDIFYGHLEYFMVIWNRYFTAIWYNLWPFGICYSHLIYFSHFGMFGRRKIWQPCVEKCAALSETEMARFFQSIKRF
jgi:hypothetical protein